MTNYRKSNPLFDKCVERISPAVVKEVNDNVDRTPARGHAKRRKNRFKWHIAYEEDVPAQGYGIDWGDCTIGSLARKHFPNNVFSERIFFVCGFTEPEQPNQRYMTLYSSMTLDPSTIIVTFPWNDDNENILWDTLNGSKPGDDIISDCGLLVNTKFRWD